MNPPGDFLLALNTSTRVMIQLLKNSRLCMTMKSVI